MTLDYTKTPDTQLWEVLEIIARQPRNPEIVAAQRAISAELAQRNETDRHITTPQTQAAIAERLQQYATSA